MRCLAFTIRQTSRIGVVQHFQKSTQSTLGEQTYLREGVNDHRSLLKMLIKMRRIFIRGR